jgi:cell division septum initiation protein DivIVA
LVAARFEGLQSRKTTPSNAISRVEMKEMEQTRPVVAENPGPPKTPTWQELMALALEGLANQAGDLVTDAGQRLEDVRNIHQAIKQLSDRTNEAVNGALAETRDIRASMEETLTKAREELQETLAKAREELQESLAEARAASVTVGEAIDKVRDELSTTASEARETRRSIDETIKGAREEFARSVAETRVLRASFDEAVEAAREEFASPPPQTANPGPYPLAAGSHPNGEVEAPGRDAAAAGTGPARYWQGRAVAGHRAPSGPGVSRGRRRR